MPIFSPTGSLSYPKVFVSVLPDEPKPTDLKSWSTTVLFTKEDTNEVDLKTGVVIWDALALAVIEKAKADFPGVTGKIEFDAKGESFMVQEIRTAKDGKEVVNRKILKMPFRKNLNGKYDEKFLYWITARKVDNPDSPYYYPPQVIERHGPKITDFSRIYPGVRARISVSIFSYKRSDNSGVSIGLNNVQRMGDGPRIAGPSSAIDEFGALDAEAPSEMTDESMGGLLG